MEQFTDKHYDETVAFLQARTTIKPRAGVILGSGLGQLVSEINIETAISYADIPHFPISTVEGHAGRLIFGTVGNTPVVAMQGRFHYYEGYSMQQVTYPVRIMALLGVKELLVSNASGGLNSTFRTGDLMLITDHINFFPEHPLRGANNPRFGLRFPDMGQTYNPQLNTLLVEIARKNAILLRQGVYIGSSGPSLETPAEYALFGKWGADATGMSTVPEVIVAHHCGLRCCGISVITNESALASQQPTTHEDVQLYASQAEPRLTLLFTELLKSLA